MKVKLTEEELAACSRCALEALDKARRSRTSNFDRKPETALPARLGQALAKPDPEGCVSIDRHQARLLEARLELTIGHLESRIIPGYQARIDASQDTEERTRYRQYVLAARFKLDKVLRSALKKIKGDA